MRIKYLHHRLWGEHPLYRHLQLLFAARQRTRAVATAPADPRDGLRQAMAAADAGDGGGIDGPCLDPTRGAALSRAAVATTRGGCEEESAGEGATGGGELTRGRCVRTAGFEGVTRSERAAGRPGEPSRIELFDPLAVDGRAGDI
jgi:hypothetical protein